MEAVMLWYEIRWLRDGIFRGYRVHTLNIIHFVGIISHEVHQPVQYRQLDTPDWFIIYPDEQSRKRCGLPTVTVELAS